MRRTPDLPSSSRHPQLQRHNSNSSHASTEAGFPALGKSVAPRTPPLMRKGSYDNDAEVERFSESGFYDDEGSFVGEDGELTPTGSSFGREL
jgi:hypothetical protein